MANSRQKIILNHFSPKVGFRWLMWSLCAGIGLAILHVFLGRGSFYYNFLVLISPGYVASPVLFTAILLFLINMRWQNPWLVRAVLMCMGVLLISYVQLLALPLSRFVADADIKDAQVYAENLVPFLERYQEEEGSYPLSIASWKARHPNIPYLLNRSDGFYVSDGLQFRFEFPNISERNSGFVYESRSGEWEHQESESESEGIL